MSLKFAHENHLRAQGFSSIAGVDEAGRGPLAGPVVAAACILPQDVLFPEINDSKELTPRARQEIYCKLVKHPKVHFGIGQASVLEIDTHNILQATFLAMQRAVRALPVVPDYLLIDGNRAPKFSMAYSTLVDGDTLSYSIGAASIIAKVYRDHLMELLGIRWPNYRFEKHKGYGTKEHCLRLAELGPCLIHRMTFAPVRTPFIQEKKSI